MRRYAVRFVAGVGAVVGAVVIVATALAACGGGGGADDAQNGSPTTGASAGSGAPGTQPVDTKFTGVGSAEYCRLARTFQDAQSRLNPTNTSPDLRQLFQDAARDIKAAVGVAPAEIKSDVQIVADGFGALVGALNASNYDFSRLPPELILRYQSQEFVTASTRVGAYARSVCGVGG